MRENMGIYRGKRVDNGEMVEGFYSCVTDNYTPKNRCYITTFKSLDNGEIVLTGQFEVVPETVGEHTGQFDNNKKPIFEADIVGITIPLINAKPIIKRRAVYFCENGFCVEWRGNNQSLSGFAPNVKIEVIGNIHDNPELLKEGAGNG